MCTILTSFIYDKQVNYNSRARLFSLSFYKEHEAWQVKDLYFILGTFSQLIVGRYVKGKLHVLES